jgi:hypothetical protein
VLGKDLMYRQPQRTKRIMKKEKRRPVAPTKEADLSCPERQVFFLTIFHGRIFSNVIVEPLTAFMMHRRMSHQR